MNTQTQEALKMAIEALLYGTDHTKAVLACKEALESQEPVNEFNPDWDGMAVLVEQNKELAMRIEELESQEQEPVACPYPCGWNNLYKITTEKGAYLVTHFDIDKPMPYSYWQEISSMVDTARTLVKWGMNIKAHPAHHLNDDDVVKLAVICGSESDDNHNDKTTYEFDRKGLVSFVARAIEKAHGIE